MEPDERSLKLAWVGDCCLRVELGGDASEATHRRVVAAYEQLKGASVAHLREIVPAYATVLVRFDAMKFVPEEAEKAVRAAIGSTPLDASAPRGRLVEVPVCYEGECAPDIEFVASEHGISVEDVAARHSETEYTVAFIGFVPGFAYLHGLPAGLHTRRLDSPRTRVPAGSVGITGGQTGIYPGGTPGGWRLVGRTPQKVFDAGRAEPSLLAMNDRVRFVRIGFEEYRKLMRAEAMGESSEAKY